MKVRVHSNVILRIPKYYSLYVAYMLSIKTMVVRNTDVKIARYSIIMT